MTDDELEEIHRVELAAGCVDCGAHLPPCESPAGRSNNPPGWLCQTCTNAIPSLTEAQIAEIQRLAGAR